MQACVSASKMGEAKYMSVGFSEVLTLTNRAHEEHDDHIYDWIGVKEIRGGYGKNFGNGEGQ